MEITSDTIIEYLKEAVEQKKNLNPNIWIDAALKLNLLLGDDIAVLYDLQKKVAEIKLNFLSQSEKRNVSEAKMRVETTEEYREMKLQESKCKRIEEFIRLAKIQAKVNGGF